MYSKKIKRLSLASALVNAVYIAIYLCFAVLHGKESASVIVVMLLPSVLSLVSVSLILWFKGITSAVVLCVIAWVHSGVLLMLLPLGISSEGSYPVSHARHYLQLLMLCVCIAALFLNYQAAQLNLCFKYPQSEKSFKRRAVISICLEALFLFGILWKNVKMVLFVVDSGRTLEVKYFTVSPLIVSSVAVAIATIVFAASLLKGKAGGNTVRSLVWLGIISLPLAYGADWVTERLVAELLPKYINEFEKLLRSDLCWYVMLSPLFFAGMMSAISAAVRKCEGFRTNG